MVGRDIYVREGCYNCHSQMIRPFRAEALRYGPYSVAGEFVYDRPHQWGSKRTGPDLARVGGRYSDDWHRAHLNNPRDVVPESNMPAYPWLERSAADADTVQTHMRGLRTLGAPYTDEEIAKKLQDQINSGALPTEVMVSSLRKLADMAESEAASTSSNSCSRKPAIV